MSWAKKLPMTTTRSASYFQTTWHAWKTFWRAARRRKHQQDSIQHAAAMRDKMLHDLRRLHPNQSGDVLERRALHAWAVWAAAAAQLERALGRRLSVPSHLATGAK